MNGASITPSKIVLSFGKGYAILGVTIMKKEGSIVL